MLIHRVHLIEGTLLHDDTFIADTCDEWRFMTPEHVYETLKALRTNSPMRTTKEQIRECINAGCQTIVVIHKPDTTYDVHFINADTDLFTQVPVTSHGGLLQ